MTSMIFAISYFYVSNTYDNFELEMDKFVKEYYSDKKKTLKKEINTVIDILNYNIAKSNLNDEEQKSAGVFPGLLRLSVGIEYIDDIKNDLQQAFEKIK